MSQFDNVSVVKRPTCILMVKVVKPYCICFQVAKKKTLGVMLPGDYTRFGTASAKSWISSPVKSLIRLPGSDTWQTIKGGESFDVPANASFDIKVLEVTDYCCSISANYAYHQWSVANVLVFPKPAACTSSDELLLLCRLFRKNGRHPQVGQFNRAIAIPP